MQKETKKRQSNPANSRQAHNTNRLYLQPAQKKNIKPLKVKILLPLCGNGGGKTAANGGEKKKYKNN